MTDKPKQKLACHPNPCTSCPYRRDTPPGVWSREEYDKLPAWDHPYSFAGIFLCHHSSTTDRKAVCRGWLEVHENNMGVRLAMFASIDIPKDAKPTAVPLYSSGAEARRAGLRGIRRPSAKARRVIDKLVRANPARLEQP